MAHSDFGKALRIIRKAKNMTQEDFGDVSSRTYLSLLERNQKNPTLSKIEGLALNLGVHPATLVTLAYITDDTNNLDNLVSRISIEIQQIISIKNMNK